MSSCSTRPTAAGSLRATSGRPPCRSTSPSSSSAPIRTSWNSARPTAERRHTARQRSTPDPLPCKLQLSASSSGKGRWPWGRQAGSSGLAELELPLLPEVVRVQVAVRFRPVLAGPDGQRAYRSRAALRVREGADGVRPSPDPLVQALRDARRPRVLVVPAGRAIAGEGLLDVLLR